MDEAKPPAARRAAAAGPTDTPPGGAHHAETAAQNPPAAQDSPPQRPMAQHAGTQQAGAQRAKPAATPSGGARQAETGVQDSPPQQAEADRAEAQRTEAQQAGHQRTEDRPAEPHQGDWAQVIGGNVRRLRAAAGISLADLAEAGGISKTTLHGIEQGQGNPTMSTLWALATALHVPLGELLEGPGANVEITRATDPRPRARGAAVGARLLHRIRLRGTVEVYDIDIAQASQHSDPHLPGVEECMVITRGQVTTGPADAPATLAEGDSVRFGAALPHLYRGQDQYNRAVLLMLYPEA